MHTLVTLFQSLIHSVLALTWLLGITIGGYLISIVFTNMLVALKVGYPPNSARLGCWFGFLVWTLVLGLYIFGHILKSLPIWALLILFTIVIFVGLIMVLNRRQTV